MGATTYEQAAELEQRSGIEPLEALQAERTDIVREMAALYAKHGPGGTHDAMRKQYRALIACEIRDKYAENGKKLTEAECEDRACADGRYAQFLYNADVERARYAVMDDRRQALTERIARGNQLLRWAFVERAST